ncbi:MAG: hypothetical protein GX763_06285 [Clostridiaceae bacterium]|nr:hypothetical protein [Clostridiaceae bacterium]
MPFGLALFVIALLIIGIIGLILSFRRRKEKKWMIPLIIVLSAALLAFIIYALLTFIFINAADDPQSTQPLASVTETTVRTTQTSVPQTFTTPTTTTSPTTTVSSPVNIVDPEREADPSLHPDVLGLRDLIYQETPTFARQNEVTKYILHKFLNDDFDFNFYIREEFYFDEGLEKEILSAACETAMSYYLFSAYEIIDMYVEYDELNNKYLATVKLEYKEPEYDRQAREAAVEFLRDNPVPAGGFTDFEDEKAYAKEIHDFIARRITYAPIGYDPENLSYLEHYEAYQEAYNALAAPDYTAVCAGYARGFALIAQYAGINAAYVYGNEDEISSHAWNMIYPCDGSEPVLVDMTWNDTFSDDVPGQDYVYDYYFYLSLGDDYEHFPEAYYADFLHFINR